MSSEEIFQLIQGRGSCGAEKKEAELLARLRLLVTQHKVCDG